MKHTHLIVTTVIAAPGLLALGWALGHRDGSSDTAHARVTNASIETNATPAIAAPFVTPSQRRQGGEAGKERLPADFQDLVIIASKLQESDMMTELPDLLMRVPASELETYYLESAKHQRGLEQGLGLLIQDALCKKDPERALAMANSGSVGIQDASVLVSNAVRIIAKTDRERALAIVDSLEVEWLRTSAIANLGMAVGTTDPKWALDYFQSAGSALYMANQTTLMTNWAREDLAAATAYYENLPDRAPKGMLLEALIVPMAHQDADRALAFAETHRAESRRVLGEIIRTVAESDPKRAAELIQTLPPGNARLDAHRNLTRAWFRQDTEEALAWVMALEEGQVRQEMLELATEQVVKLGSVEAFDLAVNELELRDGGWLLEGAIRHARKSDLTSIRQRVNALEEGRMKSRASSALLQRLAASDFVAATEYAESLPEGPEKTQALTSFARTWANTDPKAALEWIGEEVEGDAQRETVEALVTNWSGSNPRFAAAQIEALPHSEMKQAAVTALAQSWSRMDITATLDWLGSVPEDLGREAARAAVQSGSYQEPLAAVDFLEANWDMVMGEDTQADSQVVGQIASSWGRHEPEKAADWALQLPESALRPNAVRMALAEWARRDSMSASQWLADVPSKEIRDASVPSLVEAIVHADPSSAFSWASSISDEGQRGAMIQQVAVNWARKDVHAAIDAVASASISQDLKETIMQSMP